MPELTFAVAKRVVDKAIENGAFDWGGEDAHSEALVIERAKELLDLVLQAAQNKSVAQAVLEILHAAEVDPSVMSPETLEAYQHRFGAVESSNGHAPEAPPAPAQPTAANTSSAFDTSGTAAEGTGADNPESETPALDISDIFPGYDDLKAADIKKAIIESAASGDLIEEEWERIKAYEAANEDRKTIRELQPEFKQDEPEPEPTPEPTVLPTAEQAGVTPMGVGSAPAPPAQDSVQDYYQGSALTRAAQEGLPLPQQVSTSQHPPILPIDITTVPDQELSRVATQFHSCFAYAQWLQSQEEGRERAAEHLEHEAHRDAYVSAYENHKSAIPADKMTGTAVENARRLADKDADGAEPVRKYRAAKVRHGIDARELKALASGYDKAVWRINEEMDRRARQATTARAT